MKKNIHNIPTDKWDALEEDNQDAFNRVYEKVIANKGDYLNRVGADQRTQLTPVFEGIIADACIAAVTVLHPA